MSSEATSSTPEEQIDDPRTGWVYFVSLIGIMLFLVAVYWADGAFFMSMNKEQRLSAGAGTAGLVQETVDGQKERIRGYASRKDVDADGKEIVVQTAPVSEAKSKVIEQMKAKQGR